MKLHIYPDLEELSAAVASFVCDLALQRIAQTGVFSLALAGGSTPSQTYQQLPELSLMRGLDWSSVQLFWGDERCVPPDHPQSNYRMARETFLDQLAIPPDNIHRMACEGDPEAGAERYEQTLRSHFPDQAFPQFDLILLGMGQDGHTASLFPDTSILKEHKRWVAPIYAAHQKNWRISLTLPVLNSAGAVAFLVTGEAKSGTLQEILDGGRNLPAASVQPDGELHWFIDRNAGSNLDQITPYIAGTS